MRRKERHAKKEGVVVHEYVGSDSQVEEAMQNVARKWLDARHGPQIYLSNIRLFEDCFGKRWFYAVKDSLVIGVLMLNQLEAKNGWLFNHLIVTKDAPGGTPESLVLQYLSTLQKRGFIM